MLKRLVPVMREIQGDSGRTFQVNVRPYRTQSDRIDGIVITFVDITGPKHAEAALRESQERLQLALAAANMGTFIWYPAEDRGEPDGRMLALFGQPADGTLTLAEALATMIHPDDGANYAAAIARATDPTGDGALRTDIRILQPDGALRWLAITAQVYFAGEPRQAVRMAGAAIDITERKQIEATLRANEERQAFLLQLSDALRPLADPMAVQAEACRLLGEQLGVGRAYFVEVDEAAGQARVQQNYLRGDSPSLVGSFPLAEVGWTVPYLRRGEAVVVADTQDDKIVPDADRGWMADLQMHAHISMPINKGGELMGALCVTEPRPRAWTDMDVELTRETAERIWAALVRARTEETLAINHFRLTTAMQATNAGWGNWNLLTGAADWSEKGKQLVGFASDEEARTAEGWLQRVHPEDRPKVEAHAAQVFAAHENFHLEYRVLRADGETRWLLGTGKAFYDENDTPYRSTGLIIDITERKRAEEALRESEARHRTLFDAVDEGVCLFERLPLRADGRRDYRYLAMNPAMQAMFGIPDLSGQSIRDNFPDEVEDWYDDYDHVLETGEAIRIERASVPQGLVLEMFVTRVEDGAGNRLLAVMQNVTERKRAEAALRTSEERYRLLVESAQEYAIFMLDPDGRIISWNTGAERIFGYPEEEALGMDGRVIFTADDRAAGVPEAEMATALRDGQATDDRWHLRRDGSRFWANGVMEVLRHPDGDLRGFAKVLRDNTAPKAAADALAESQERYQQALEAAQLGTWRYDVAADINYFDARSQAIFGLDRTTYSAAEVNSFIHPDDLAMIVQAREAALDPKGDGACHYVHRVVHPDRTVRWVRLNCQVTFAGEGQERHPVQAVGVIADVTERREAANALRASEERFRALVDASSQIVWTTDATGRAREDSPSWRVFTGGSYEEFSDWGWLDLIHPEDRERITHAWQEAVATVSPYHEECRQYHAASNEYRWVGVRAVPLVADDGVVQGWVGMNADIHKRKEAENALRQLNETLEVRVAARTQQVRELIIQLTMSEQTERHRISQILHDDLQQRLYGFQFQLMLLRHMVNDASIESILQQELTEKIDEIEDDINGGITLARSLSVDLSPPVLEGEGLVQTLSWLSTQMMQRHGLTVHVYAEKAIPTPSTDLRILLFQAIRESLFNIVKHASVSEAEVALSHHRQQLRIEIIDKGQGFDVEAVLNEPGHSHGVWRNRRRLELVGGQMRIESSKESGTRVILLCPLANGE